ncbi:hypothetical protein BG006_004363, partial [Podila minutissima]
MSVWGIPRAHAIITKGYRPITSKDFDDQWLLDPGAIQAEACAIQPILGKVDNLFQEISTISKAEQPYVFERFHAKWDATS